MLQRGDSDIGWADLYIIPDRARSDKELELKKNLVIVSAQFRIIDYTDPYDIEYACFMVSKPPPLPQWQALTTPLQPPVCAQNILLHQPNYLGLVGHNALICDCHDQLCPAHQAELEQGPKIRLC